MNKAKLPSKKWVRLSHKMFSKKHIYRVIRDIEENCSIKDQIREYRNSFIRFAALERMDYEADIKEELQAYLEQSRMYQINVKKWYKIRSKVFERDNYTCQYCGDVEGKLEADHIVPFSKGGADEMENLTTACRTCNRQKRDKSVTEFLKWKENNE